jgi:hypothetical protein
MCFIWRCSWEGVRSGYKRLRAVVKQRRRWGKGGRGRDGGREEVQEMESRESRESRSKLRDWEEGGLVRAVEQ